MEQDVARAYCDTLRHIHTLDWRAAGLDWMPEPPESGRRSASAQRSPSGSHPSASTTCLTSDACARRSRGRLRQPSADARSRRRQLRQHHHPTRSPAQVAAVLDWEQTHLAIPSPTGPTRRRRLARQSRSLGGARRVMRETLESYAAARTTSTTGPCISSTSTPPPPAPCSSCTIGTSSRSPGCTPSRPERLLSV